jgi:hypothetical protein
VRHTEDGTVLTLPLLAVRGAASGARECPCETAAECPPDASEPKVTVSGTSHGRWAVAVLTDGGEVIEIDKGVGKDSAFSDAADIIKTGLYMSGRGRVNILGVKVVHKDAKGAKAFEVAEAVSEARDSAAPACVPFTRLERNNEAFAACQAVANGPLESDADMYRLLSAQLGKEDQEVFVVVGLDLHRNLRSYTEVARGQRDRVAVNVEDVLRAAILDGPHGFVVAHNHPSGKANPSPADRDLTKRIRAGAAVGCPSIVFLDHIVVGQSEYFSFADNKLKKVKAK